MKNISIRVRVLTLAAILISLTIGIAVIGWHALEQVAIAISVSERENQQAQLFLLSEREISGAYSRVAAYIQTENDTFVQRFNIRRAAADSGLEKAVTLSSDPADRQATMESRRVVQEFLTSAEAIIQKRKALGQRADNIRDTLAALEMSVKRDDKASKASPAKDIVVSSAGDARSADVVQATAPHRRPPLPAARPSFLSDRATPENDGVAEAEISSPLDQSKITAEPARSAELFERAGEAALLVMISPSEATLAAHAKAMQAVENLAPPSEAAARLLVLPVTLPPLPGRCWRPIPSGRRASAACSMDCSNSGRVWCSIIRRLCGQRCRRLPPARRSSSRLAGQLWCWASGWHG
jgi:CHASE3 domain sensor protein